MEGGTLPAPLPGVTLFPADLPRLLLAPSPAPPPPLPGTPRLTVATVSPSAQGHDGLQTLAPSPLYDKRGAVCQETEALKDGLRAHCMRVPNSRSRWGLGSGPTDPGSRALASCRRFFYFWGIFLLGVRAPGGQDHFAGRG